MIDRSGEIVSVLVHVYKHVDVLSSGCMRSTIPLNVNVWLPACDAKLVESSNFRLFIIFSNLQQRKKNHLLWYRFGLELINLSPLLSSTLYLKYNS